MARLTQHIPEKHFKMIRYYGIYARHRKSDRYLHRAISKEKHKILLSFNRWRESILHSFGYDPLKCPSCGTDVYKRQREYMIEGSTNLDDLNDRLDLQLESEDYDSLGGFIIEHLDRLPEEGDSITTEDGLRLVVESLDKNRIESVHAYLPEPSVETEDDASDS